MRDSRKGLAKVCWANQNQWAKQAQDRSGCKLLPGPSYNRLQPSYTSIFQIQHLSRTLKTFPDQRLTVWQTLCSCSLHRSEMRQVFPHGLSSEPSWDQLQAICCGRAATLLAIPHLKQLLSSIALTTQQIQLSVGSSPSSGVGIVSSPQIGSWSIC